MRGRGTIPEANDPPAVEVRNLCSSLLPVGIAKIGGAWAPVSPTPSVVYRNRRCRSASRCAHCSSTRAGPCDAVNDSFEVED